MFLQTLQRQLGDRGMRYVVIEHDPAHSAQQIAESAHVPGREYAKAVLIIADDAPAIAAVPAPERLDLDALARSLGRSTARLASEEEIADQLPGCDMGAIPPFGSLFGMPTLVSRELLAGTEIAFSAGDCTEVMVLATGDYREFENPLVL